MKLSLLLNTFKLDPKSKILIKLVVISVGTVYGGYKLVQCVSPNEEELLKVNFQNYLI